MTKEQDGKGKKNSTSDKLLQQAQEQMNRDYPWADWFDRMVRDIFAAPDSAACWRCREHLDRLVSDELLGVDIKQQYPDMIAHIADCEECRRLYESLRDILQTDQLEESVPVMSSTALPTPASDEPEAWHRQCGYTHHPFPLVFRATRQFVTYALRGPQLNFVRGEIGDAEGSCKRLLFTDLVPTDQGDLWVEAAIYRRLDRPQTLDLGIRLISDWALPAGLRTCLSWAGVERQEPVSGEGIALFTALPISQLVKPRDKEPKVSVEIAFTCD